MKVLVQRVLSADLNVDGKKSHHINKGLVVYVGLAVDDQDKNQWLAKKLVELRVFEDMQQKLNLSLKDIDGELLLISNFTLCGDAQKGTRPSFDKAMRYNEAKKMYQSLVVECEKLLPNKVFSGEFGSDMQINQLVDGPVNIIIE